MDSSEIRREGSMEAKNAKDDTGSEKSVEDLPTTEPNDDKLEYDEVELGDESRGEDSKPKGDTSGEDDEQDGFEMLEDEYMFNYEDDGTGSVTRSHFIPKGERDQCQTCSASFLSRLSRWPHHCRRCGDVFCSPCLIYRKRLNVWAQPDANGILCKVCIKCYGETETVLFGVKRSQTEYFVGLRKQCKTERRHILCDLTIDRRNGSIVPASWREQLQVDIPRECKRLLEGFKLEVGSSDAQKAIHELTDKFIVPSWQKAKYWTLDGAVTVCRQCGGLLKGKKFRNCRVCALALCKKCSLKELLVYYDDRKPPGKTAEPKLAIIQVPGSPEKEPRYSLCLTVCRFCRDDLAERQRADHDWYARISRPPDPDLMSRIMEVDHTFRDLTADIYQKVERLGEIREIQMSKSPGKSADNNHTTSGDADNNINNYHQEIRSLKEETTRSLDRYYQLFQSLKKSISGLSKTAHSKELKFARNYIEARNKSYIMLRSKESRFDVKVV